LLGKIQDRKQKSTILFLRLGAYLTLSGGRWLSTFLGLTPPKGLHEFLDLGL